MVVCPPASACALPEPSTDATVGFKLVQLTGAAGITLAFESRTTAENPWAWAESRAANSGVTSTANGIWTTLAGADPCTLLAFSKALIWVVPTATDCATPVEGSTWTVAGEALLQVNVADGMGLPY